MNAALRGVAGGSTTQARAAASRCAAATRGRSCRAAAPRCAAATRRAPPPSRCAAATCCRARRAAARARCRTAATRRRARRSTTHSGASSSTAATRRRARRPAAGTTRRRARGAPRCAVGAPVHRRAVAADDARCKQQETPGPAVSRSDSNASRHEPPDIHVAFGAQNFEAVPGNRAPRGLPQDVRSPSKAQADGTAWDIAKLDRTQLRLGGFSGNRDNREGRVSRT